MKTKSFRTNDDIAEIYSRLVKTIYGVCYPYLRNAPDTEDAVSETFIRLMRAEPFFESPEHEKAWLIRTAINVCKDLLKHWSRRTGEISDIADLSDTLSNPENPRADGLLSAVCAMPEKYKAVIQLYYYEGYATREIGEILHKPHSTIRSYLSEARELLRGMIDDD